MAAVRVPVDLRNPRVASLAGNSFWSVKGLTDLDLGVWEFVKDVDGKIYGVVPVPKNLAATPNGKLILELAANATTGDVRLNVGTKAIADGESLNPAALTDETAQTISMPGTAYFRKTVTFPSAGSLAEALAADDLLLVEIFHDGDDAADTLAVNLLLVAAFLQVDVG